MSNAEIIQRVNELMHKGFEIPKEKLLPEATLFEALGLDSLDAVDMLVHLEENFGIKVDGERVTQIRTLQDVYNLVAEVAAPSIQSSTDQINPVLQSKEQLSQNLT
jgi:acyl carrier protein